MDDKTIAIEIKVEGLENVRLSTTELDKLAATKARNKKESADTAKVITAEAGSMAQLRAETALLTAKLNQLGDIHGKNKETAKAWEQQIISNKEKIRDFDRQLSGSTTLVGEYAKGFGEAFKGMGTQIMALASAGAVLGGIGDLLGSFYTANQEGSDRLSERLAGMEGALDVIKSKFIEAGKYVDDFLSKGNNNKGHWYTSLFKDIAETFSVVITGPIGILATKNIESTKVEMDKAANIAEHYKKSILEIKDAEIEEIVPRERMNTKIKEARELLITEGVAIKDKIKAVKDVIQWEKEQSAIDISYQQQKVAAMSLERKDMKELGTWMREDEENYKSESAKVESLAGDSAMRLLKLGRELKKFNKEENVDLNDSLLYWRTYFDEKNKLIQEQVRDVGFFGEKEMLKSRKSGVGEMYTDFVNTEDKEGQLSTSYFSKVNTKSKSPDPEGDRLRKYVIAETKKQARELKKINAENDEEIKQNKIDSYQFAFSAIGNLANSLGSLFEANKQKELSSAGDNAEKRAAIEAKYAKKQQLVQIAQAITGTATGIINALSIKPVYLVPWAVSLAAVTGAMQLAVIESQKFAQGGLLQGRSHAQGGIPIRVNGQSGYEAEGGEAIINKRSTAKYRTLLSRINQEGGGKKFAMGGVIPEQSNAMGMDLNRLAQMISSQINSIQVINSVGEFHKANAIYTQANTRSAI